MASMAKCKENDEEKFDLSKKLLESRTVIISGTINKKLAEKVNKQLLLLAAENDDDIKVFIDSPGGDADAGYGIFDMIRYIKPEVKTISNGLTASAGVIILLAAKKENRLSLPNSRFLIHQPSSGMMGVAADIKIHADEILKLKQRVNKLIAEETGQDIKTVERDTDRDRWLSPEAATEYGLISRVVTSSDEL